MTYWGTKILLNLKNTVDLTMHVIKFLLIVIHAPPRPVTPTCRYLNQNALKQHTATVWTQQERCQITYDNYTPQLLWKVFVGTLGSRLAQRREVSRWCEQQKSLTREMSARGRRWNHFTARNLHLLTGSINVSVYILHVRNLQICIGIEWRNEFLCLNLIYNLNRGNVEICR